MSWFIDRTSAGRTGSARPWLPPLARGPDDGQQPVSAPPLTFDEAELAHVMACLVDRTARDVRAVEAASPAARQARALDRLAGALEEAVRVQSAAERDAVSRIVALASAIGRVLGPTARDPDGLAALVGEMLTGLGAPAVRIAAAPAAIELLRPLLPEIAARAGFGGTVELETAPQLADGALRLVWPGGWLTRDPEDAARRVEALLAPLRTQGAMDQISLERTPDDQS